MFSPDEVLFVASSFSFSTEARAQALGDLRAREQDDGADELGTSVPTLRPVQSVESERYAYLTETQAERLLRAYNPWAGPVMQIRAGTGLPMQEELRLD